MLQPSALRFTLSFVDGCGVLQLENRALGPAGRADRLALDIPGLRFPFDLSGGLNSFQNRLSRLRELQLSFSGEELAGALARAPLADFGLSDPLLELVPGGLCFAARAALGGAEAQVTFRAALQPVGPVQLRLVVERARVYGFLPVPAPALALAVFRALGTEGGGGRGKRPGWAASLLRVAGPAVLELQALDLSLLPLMAAQGWRLPDQSDVHLHGLDLDASRLQLRFGRQPGIEAKEGGGPLDPRYADGEAALAAGDYPFALAAYRRAHEGAPDDRFARERLLQLLGSSRPWHAELEQRVGALPADEAGVREARALLAAERGEPAVASALYREIAEEAERAGEPLTAACARVASAEQLSRAGQGAPATRDLERARELRPDHPGALQALRQRLRAEGRWEELSTLLWQQAARETTPERRASALSEGGLVLLEHLSRPGLACERFEQALRLAGEDPGAREGLGLLKRASEPAAALELLEQAGRGYAAHRLTAGQARVEAALASLHEEAGDSESALAGFRRAAEMDLLSPEPLCRAAALLGKLGRTDEAVELLEQAIEQAPEVHARVRVLRQLAALEREGRRDPVAARQRLEQALKLHPADAAALQELAADREAEGDGAALEPFLRRALAAAAGPERAAVGALARRIAEQVGSSGLMAESLAALATSGAAGAARPALELAALAERLDNPDLLLRAASAIEGLLSGEAAGGEPLPVAQLANRLAALRLRQGNREASESLSRRVLDSLPDAETATAAWRTIVKCALDRGDAAAVRTGLLGWAEDARVSDEPEARAARLVEAAALERDRLGSFATAVPLFERAQALDPHNRQALLGLAGAAEHARQWPRLEDLLRQLLALEPPPARAVRHRLAEVLLRRGGRLDEALRLYEGLLDQDPEDPRAAVGLGRALWSSGRLEESLVQYERVIAAQQRGSTDQSLGTWAAEAHVRLAQSARLLGEVGNANRHLQEALTGEPERGAPVDVLVEVMEAFGQTESLLVLLERRRACAATPALVREASRALGVVLERNGRADEAVAVYRSLLESAPDHAPALLRLAEIFRREGRRSDLIQPLERLLDLAVDPGAAGDLDPEAIGLELQVLLQETGAGSERIEAVLRRVLAARPQSSEVLLELFELLQAQPSRAAEAFATLALLYRQTGLSDRDAGLGRSLSELAENAAVDPRLAASVLEDVVLADHRDPLLVEALLNLYDRLPVPGQRLARMRALIERVPQLDGAPRIRVHLALAAAAEREQDFTTAEEELGRALAIDTDPATRAAQLVSRARIRLQRGMAEAAASDLQAAQRVLPGHPEALLLLADLAETGHQWAEALDHLDHLTAGAGWEVLIAPDRLALRRATVALQAGAPQRARACLEDLLAVDPDDLPAREMLVDAQLRTGDVEAARAQLEHLTAAHPDRAPYWSSLADLYRRLGRYREAADALGGLARSLQDPRPRAKALVSRGDLLRDQLDDPAAALYAYRLAQEADPTFVKTAVRIIETRWQAGDLPPDALADRMVEVAIHCAGDARTLDEALSLVADTDGGILIATLREVLAARTAAGSPDPATAALAHRLLAAGARSGS